jgi:hypothetical protein
MVRSKKICQTWLDQKDQGDYWKERSDAPDHIENRLLTLEVPENE